MSRYLGMETCTSPSQVVRYLTENYTDKEGSPMLRAAATEIVAAGAAQVQRGIDVFRSNVEYLGDEAIKGDPRWVYLPDPEDEPEPEAQHSDEW